MRCGIPALLGQPRLSKMAWLPEWKTLAGHSDVREILADSCAFLTPTEFIRAPFQKAFRFLLSFAPEVVPCSVVVARSTTSMRP